VVQGDEVSGYRIFIHVPEDWLRKQNESTLAKTAQVVLLLTFLAAFGVSFVVIFLRNLKSPEVTEVPWRRIGLWSLVILGASLARVVTLEQLYLLAYRTEQPFSTFVATLVIGQTLGAILFYSATILVLGLGIFFLLRGYGLDCRPFSYKLSARYYWDAILVMGCGSAVVLALQRLRYLVAAAWPVQRYAFPASVPQGLDANWPAAGALANALLYSFLAIGMVALALGFAARYLRSTWIQMILIAAFAMLSAIRWGSAGELFQSSLLNFAEFAVIWCGVRYVARLNFFGYFLLGMFLSLAPAIGALMEQPNLYYRTNGAILIAAIALLLAITAVWLRSAGRRRKVANRDAVPV
jgi:hypothetical protein